jgi:hypothetical protein
LISRLLLPFLFAFFIFGCAKVTPKKTVAPKWVTDPKSLNSFQAVGFSIPNFQGMHLQKMEAIIKARAQLGEKITSFVIIEHDRRIKNSTNYYQEYDHTQATNISKLILANSYQKDAFIDKNGNLYILLEIAYTPELQKILGVKIKSNVQLPKLKTYSYTQDALLKRRCYSQKILKTIKTKYPLHNGYPIWFFRPNIEGKQGAVGIAEQLEDSSLESQKKVSLILAKTALAKRNQIQINSIYKLSTILIHDEEVLREIRHIVTNSKSNIKDITVKDIWMDPKQCELYTWIIE